MIQKKIKRENFNILDSALSCLWYLILQFVLLTGFSMLPKTLLGSEVITYIAQILVEAVFFVAVYLNSRIRDVDFVKATKLNSKIDAKIILYGFILAFITMICFAPLTDLFLYAIQALGYKYYSTPIDVSNFGLFILCLIVHCAVPAVCEETLFRGAVLRGLEQKGKHFAVIISALIFTLMHGWPVQTMHQFVIGIILGYLFIYTNNIWVPIFTHFFNNAISITMLYMQNIFAPDLVMKEKQLIEFTKVNTTTLLLNIAYAIVMAVLGVMLTITFIKIIKRHLDSKNKVNETSENAGSESEKENIENLKTPENVNIENKLKKFYKSEKFWAIICFIIIGISLVSDWVIALFEGLLL